MPWYNPVSWFSKEENQDLLPDLVRQPVAGEFKLVFQEYDARRSKEKIVLCLEGGGAKGRFQAGVLARMAEIGLLRRVDTIIGTSVGGMNACVTARYMDDTPNLQDVVDIWRGIKSNSDIYLGEMPTSIWTGLKTVLGGGLTGKSILDNTPQYDLVKKHLDGITEFRVPVYCVTTDYVTHARRLLGPGTSAVDMALATSAVPVAFKCYQGKYMDGGCVENLAIPTALNLGSSKIVAIYCDADPSKMPVSAPDPSSITTGIAALGALFQVQSDREYDNIEKVRQMREIRGQDPIEVIHMYPSGHTGDLLEFGARPDLLKMGYEIATKYLTPDYVREFLQA